MIPRVFCRRPIQCVLFLILLGSSADATPCQTSLQIAPPKKTDSYAEDEKGRKFRVQHGELAENNFRIAGVDLAHEGEILDQAARILGHVKTRATGDASSSDERACYRPADKTDKTRLYFHRGEVCPSFVLSLGTPAPETLDVCRPSNDVTIDIATGSGLHLGQTIDEVTALLGLPTRRSHNAKTGRDFIAYEFETKKEDSPKEFAQSRKEHPNMTKRELMQNDYGYFDLGESIQVTFENQKLTELQVNWCGTD